MVVTPSPSVDVALQQLLEVARQQAACVSHDDVSDLYHTAITLLLGKALAEKTSTVLQPAGDGSGGRKRRSTASASHLQQLTEILHGGASLSSADFSLIIAAFGNACKSAIPARQACTAGALDVHMQAILGVFLSLANMARTHGGPTHPARRPRPGDGNAISLISSNLAGAFDPTIHPFHCAYPAIATSACISRLLLQRLTLPELLVLLLQQCGDVAEQQYARMLCFALAPAHIDRSIPSAALKPADALASSDSTGDQGGLIAPGTLEALLVQLLEWDHVLLTRIEAWVLAVAAAHSTDLTVYLLQLRHRLGGWDGWDGQCGQDGQHLQEDEGASAQRSIVEHLDVVVDCMSMFVADPDQQQLLHRLQLQVAAAHATPLQVWH
jgi:hypothetical protein